jgi:ABC-type sugar transport system substrate-binding protein
VSQSKAGPPSAKHIRRGIACLIVAAVAVMAVAVSAVGKTTHKATAASSGKLFIMEFPFACGLNQYAQDLCQGATAEARDLPAGDKFEIKTGTNYEDTSAFNSIIQTSLQLHPSGLIIFPNGTAAQTPVLNQGCSQGVNVIFVDSSANGVKCEKSFVTVSAYEEGELDGEYLVAHPPSPNSKQVAVVEQQPGLFSSNDLRVKGFEQTVEKAGYKVVASVVGSNEVSQTRGLVATMYEAHPNLAGVFSANPYLGDGTELGLKGDKGVVQTMIGGLKADMPAIENGTVGANAADDPYAEGVYAVKYLLDLSEGKSVPKTHLVPTEVITKANVHQYLKAGAELH